jgi:hypothetical protein
LLVSAIVTVVLMVWKFSRSAEDSPPPRAESSSQPASNAGIEPVERAWLPPSEPVITTVAQDFPPAQTNLSKDALLARVVAYLREWEDQDDSELRPQRLQELDALLNGTNTFDLFDIVQELPPDLMGFAFALSSLQQRMMADPKAAADWMSAHTNISESQALTLLHNWGQKDREEMRQYLTGLPEGEWKQTVIVAASNDALTSDPVEAIVWARQMNPGEQQTSFLQMATTKWAKRDPEAVAQWVGQVNDPALREQLAGSLAVGYAELDPALAAGWVVQSVQPGEVLDRSLAEIAWTWAMQEPVAAGTWVARFPEGPARKMALGNLMGVWGNRDRAAALDWIEGLPGGSLQTEAAVDLLETIPAAEPSAQ